MPQIDPCKIKEYFKGFSLPTVKNLLLLVEAIIYKRTTNLNVLKDCVPILKGNQVEASSNYHRLIRFFKHPQIDSLIERILTINQNILRTGRIRWLAIDRTNWKFGRKNINLLVLSCIYHNVSVPIMWKQLNKQGNSNFQDRKKLIDRITDLCCLKSAMLLADREFIGLNWFQYLLEKKIHFLIRIKKDDYKSLVNNPDKKQWHRNLIKKALGGRNLAHTFIELDGYRLNYIIMKNPNKDPKEPLLFFITDRSTAARRLRLQRYRDRWSIECCFKHLKTNGFNLEDVHFRDDKKIELMMALVSMAYCLSLREGINKNKTKPIKTKKYNDGKIYPSQSIFRAGLSIISTVIYDLTHFIYYLLDIFSTELKNV